MKRNSLIFIPARGGSKGISNKNLQQIDGHSLVGRLVSKCVKLGANFQNLTVVVSTNDEHIATEAKKAGAAVHWRPDEICSDNSSTEEALVHYLQLQDSSTQSTAVAMLQCTSPFTSSSEILEGFRCLSSGFNSAFIGVRNHFWLYANKNGSKEPIGHQLDKRPSRQSIPEQYHETGAGYFFLAEEFLQHRFRLFGRIGFVDAGYLGYVDIDEPEDLAFAKKIASLETSIRGHGQGLDLD